ncbi:MAG: hypothetical protein D8M58_04535 [Calditrichaeota bacterium]|nr:MAG: hypothetical protein DWQ03_02540 [Calditrichota bacterium]MBL1204638.1 hypothetical protein [Calditrichota bacterium]NOG44466.1 hypothetical protein [Calditrichota bacterium]
MLKFFRNIRKQLAAKNKVTKYLWYAIGEILLVVIGILVALQVNNWNENQKAKVKETKVLNQLVDGLTLDRDKLEKELKKLKKVQYSIKELEKVLDDPDNPYNAELDTLFGMVYGMRNITLNKAFYEDLKTSGIHLIKNEKIRRKIVHLFENNYAQVFTLKNFEIHVNDVIRPYYLNNFQKIEFSVSAQPIDYNKIWNDPYYKNIVNYRYKTLEINHIAFFTKTIKAINSLFEEIEPYLKERNQ